MRPEIGPLDPALVAETFLAALASGAGAERIMGQVWRDGHVLRVERRPPFETPSGKILHLHLERRPVTPSRLVSCRARNFAIRSISRTGTGADNGNLSVPFVRSYGASSFANASTSASLAG